MKILVLQHTAADGPGEFENIARALGHEVRVISTDSESIPTDVESDALALFGGAHSLADNPSADWALKEQDLIRRYVDSDCKVFGICLGAQLVASALGASVTKNRVPELGWHAVRTIDGSGSSLFAEVFAGEPTVLHWHQETFGIPPGADHVLTSDACDHQAFEIGNQVVGFQCHLEATERIIGYFSAGEFARNAPTELDSVQSVAEIKAEAKVNLPKQRDLFKRFLTRWLEEG